jgi:hypothetical protein
MLESLASWTPIERSRDHREAAIWVLENCSGWTASLPADWCRGQYAVLVSDQEARDIGLGRSCLDIAKHCGLSESSLKPRRDNARMLANAKVRITLVPQAVPSST